MPDLNSVPSSPRFLTASSRRASSQQMPPPPPQPPAPGSPSLHILPSNQNTVNPSNSSSLPSPSLPAAASFPSPPMNDNTGVGPGPGPLRHPRPLTAAELHLQLEKEQEAVVNRLTRELSILRAAHNASVVSNASSTSASASGTEPGQWGDSANSLGSNYYQPVRHHRTSSSTSARSLTAHVGSLASVSTTSLAGISSPAPVRGAAQAPIGGISLSRQNSSASRRSRAGSPAPAPPRSISGSSHHHTQQQQQQQQQQHHHHLPASDPTGSLPGYFASPRVPIPPMMRSQSGTGASTSAMATPASTTTTSELSPGILPATSRYEETALRRAELDEVKRENEALRRRVRELEKLVRDAALLRETGPASFSPSSSSAAAAARAGAGGEERARAGSMRSLSGVSVVEVGVPEEEVGVGESAASGGVGKGRGRGRGTE